MKVLGLALTSALVAVALLAVPHGQPSAGDAVVLAGIDGSGGPQAVCDRTADTRTGGCPFDGFERIVLAGISGGDQP